MPIVLSAQKIKNFQEIIWKFFALHGRTLPWRETNNPYKILVSEIMLQQTQVSRVLPKYDAFLKRFPTVQSLANASLQEVFSVWVGLGYNRRARYLHQTAQKITADHNGVFPKTSKALQALPGIGPYTARAVSTFAYNNKEVLIETNIRTVYIHHFFQEVDIVSDAEILPLIEATLPTQNTTVRQDLPAGLYRAWYWALMDYGAHLKETFPNPSRKSKHHTTQSQFKGSLREARGLIIRVLSAEYTSTAVLYTIGKQYGIERERIQCAIHALAQEGFIVQKDAHWQLGKNTL